MPHKTIHREQRLFETLRQAILEFHLIETSDFNELGNSIEWIGSMLRNEIPDRGRLMIAHLIFEQATMRHP